MTEEDRQTAAHSGALQWPVVKPWPNTLSSSNIRCTRMGIIQH